MSVQHCCEPMRRNLTSEDDIVRFEEKFREYGIPVHDGGSSYIQITHCPWCGAPLPASLRESWFATLERRQLDPFSNDLPEEFTDSRWYTQP